MTKSGRPSHHVPWKTHSRALALLWPSNFLIHHLSKEEQAIVKTHTPIFCVMLQLTSQVTASVLEQSR